MRGGFGWCCGADIGPREHGGADTAHSTPSLCIVEMRGDAVAVQISVSVAIECAGWIGKNSVHTGSFARVPVIPRASIAFNSPAGRLPQFWYRPSMDPSTDNEPIEYELMRQASLLEIKVKNTQVEPTVGDDGSHVRIEIQVDEDLLDSCGLGLLFAFGLLSFHDGRPRGYSGKWFDDDDEWTVTDLIGHFRFVRGKLILDTDYLRGRCMKTEVTISSDGKVTLETVNRGEAALRWVDKLKGKNYLQAVE